MRIIKLKKLQGKKTTLAIRLGIANKPEEKVAFMLELRRAKAKLTRVKAKPAPKKAGILQFQKIAARKKKAQPVAGQKRLAA